MTVRQLRSNRSFRNTPTKPMQLRVRATSGVNVTGANLRSASHWSDLKDPCHIWAVGNKSVRVKNDFKSVSLEDYMRLPVSQYCVLDPSLIKPVDDDSFAFSVPRLEFFNEWVKPSVIAQVLQLENKVHIKTQKAEVDVSDLLGSLNLDQRWFMIFDAVLTWDNSFEESENMLRGFQRSLLKNNGTPGRSGMIHGYARVDVWCELGQQFAFMNNELLQNACNLALSTLMGSLMPIFMTKLAEDYTKWASDESYRKEREMWDLKRAK
eukprot:g3901.t1